jgi:hypothetical protein
MRVRMFDGGFEEFGATRYQIEWITIKPSASGKDSIDPDTDTITQYEYRTEKDAALQRAQELFDTTDDLCWGVVTVRKQVVDWFYEEDGIAGWEETDEEIDII